MMTRLGLAVVTTLAVTAPSLTVANEANISGQLDFGLRYYFDDGQYAGQDDAGFYEFTGFSLNGNFAVGAGEVVLQFTGLNDDANDRSLFNVEKAYFTQSFDNWDYVLGYNVENWGVSNGRTLVNVLNARNLANQVGDSDLIGTPMANANIFTDAGTFSFYLLGDNIEGNFGGRATRQRGPFPVTDQLVQYEDSDSLDVAFRFANSYAIGEGSLDLGLSVFDGTNRDALRLPTCVQEDSINSAAVCDQFNADVLAAYQAGANTAQAAGQAGAGSLTALTPFYQEIRQYGLTAVYAQGNTQLRFEGFLRETVDEDFAAAIIGGDQSFYNFMGGDGTLTVALEYHYDDRSDRQPISVYDDDLFFGVNYRANDTHDSQVDFGIFYDLNESSQIITLSASRRIGDRVRIGLNANHINADSAADALSTVDGNSYIEFSVSTFF